MNQMERCLAQLVRFSYILKETGIQRQRWPHVLLPVSDQPNPEAELDKTIADLDSWDCPKKKVF